MIIKELDRKTAEQIAAGEVIENPASVVKELVENALDAGATTIAVEIEGGGKRLISVTDNGHGIQADQLPLAFKRFATSKLSLIDDLCIISSLGFRGEALPSIAAVSRVSFTSRRQNDLSGSRICFSGGEINGQEEVGSPPGTRAEVRDLFFNTPGRLKFLRADPVESSRISALLTELALAHPAVSFSLKSGNRSLISTTGDGSLLHAIGALYGNETAEKMLKLSREDKESGSSLKGFTSAPHFTKSSRRWITLVVNGRLIKNPMLVNALERGYGDLMPRQRYPLAVLHLLIPPNTLDVNVHPAKVEIRFESPENAKNLIYKAVQLALQDGHRLPEWPVSERKYYSFPHQGPARAHPGLPAAWKEKRLFDQNNSEEPLPEVAREVFPVPNSGEPEADPGSFRLIGQYLQSYLVVQKEDKLMLIDQHAAHERLIYHKLQQDEEAEGDPARKEGAQLTIPLGLDLPSAWRSAIPDLLPPLRKSGFYIEPIGEDSYAIRSVPFLIRDSFNSSLVYDIIEQLISGDSGSAEARQDTIRKTIACHRSIKAGQALTRSEMERLIEEWEKVPRAHFCPHGRPTVISFDRSQLEKSFLRRGS
jgi:DNA mismatch repair protein MutL